MTLVPRLRPNAILCALFGGLLVVVPGTLRAADDAEKWNVYVGQAVVDTLDGSLSEVFTAGSWVLNHDSWTIERQDAATGKLVTAWKPVKHKLLKLATGPAKVRVAVALKSVGSGRTEVQVTGGIASQAQLKGPLLPLAQNAGQHECRGYVEDLKVRLALDQLSDGAPSASPRSTSGKR